MDQPLASRVLRGALSIACAALVCCCGDDDPADSFLCLEDRHCLGVPDELLPRDPVEHMPFVDHQCRALETGSGYCRCTTEACAIVNLSGASRDSCLARARDRTCLYERDEFPGCDPETPDSCEATCAELDMRRELDAARTLAFHRRGAYCRQGDCYSIFEIEGTCFSGTDETAFDCELTDEEILGRVQAAEQAQPEEPRPINPPGSTMVHVGGLDAGATDRCP